MNRFGSWREIFQWDNLMVSAGLAVTALLAGVVLFRLLWSFLGRLVEQTAAKQGAILIARLRRPARVTIPLLVLMVVQPTLAFPAEVRELLQHLFSILFIAATSWLLIDVIVAGRDIVLSRYDFEAKDNLRARAVYTQLTVLVKIAVVIVSIVAVATMLMTFERIRQVGMSILASAGIAGIIIGFAAQRSIATLLAGLQIAITQPIRLGDIVIVEGEWGTVEEISLTYVVIRIWDLRRLVVPVTYFLDKPFQNWTRVSANLLGTVFIYTDYTLPVEELRQELHRILESSANWDRETWGLQMTKVSEQTMELRALMSAADSTAVWDLRCEVREKLVEFIRRHYPASLPRLRTELHGELPGGSLPLT
ncbi:mechanosensitive ion channel protein MscS [Geotalea uraniireducens]|uniref:Mechanosensitive ion channel protein MscS n=1 Tax=Geotalea uraniireducens TaxID=351604 RepID=A0ABN6VX47_9BACT|nr:mechanosensitive ion channel domain-containing protein [Geotalea uraniireducens]BDV42990.1 mechanosensitive ion channel protein MscS [Geotalea uraniireducens]